MVCCFENYTKDQVDRSRLEQANFSNSKSLGPKASRVRCVPKDASGVCYFRLVDVADSGMNHEDLVLPSHRPRKMNCFVFISEPVPNPLQARSKPTSDPVTKSIPRDRYNLSRL